MIQPDLFRFHYTNPEFHDMRCFLGNGYFSTELSNSYGQGIAFCKLTQAPFPIMRVAGVYSYPNSIPKTNQQQYLPLDTLFRAMNMIGVYPLDPDNPNHPEPEDIDFYPPKNFKQILDMKQAVCITSGQVEAIDFKTEIFLSRSNPNFGAMKLSVMKSDGSHFSFEHRTRKDPFSKLQKVEMSEEGSGINLWQLQFLEDNYEFQKRGLYNLAQITGIEILDENKQPIKYSLSHSEEDTESVDYGNLAIWKSTINCEIPQISADQKYHCTLILYFGIYKQSDFESPRYLDISPNADQGLRAKLGLSQVMKIGYDELFKEHVAAWEKDIWQNLIEIPGSDEKIQRMIISSYYVMGCTYLDGLAYGNGPNGINGHWWCGRTFWDHDLWVNMGIILWAPSLARNFNQFRFNTIAGARENRRVDVEKFRQLGILEKYGLAITDGLKYPWESTTSGLERTPNGGRPNIQEHISCDVIHGMWLQYIVTKDRQFLEKIAFPVAYESAIYLGQRVKKEADNKWHFRYVLCADEHADQKDDNAFTNLYLEKCMKIVIGWCKLLGKKYPPHWDEISENMKYHFDPVNMRIIEHETYTNEIIKQADTDLITWPLEHNVVYGKDGEIIKRNNMLFYFNRLPEYHIMMGACIFSIIAAELGMQEKAWEYFSDQFPHFHPDLSYIPSENPKNECWPFITGIGGFLSNLIYGFGGIRIREDGLLFDPHLDPKLPHLIIPHIYFQGLDLRYEVKEGGTQYSLTNQTESRNFKIYIRNDRVFIPEKEPNVHMNVIKDRLEQYFDIILPQNQSIIFHKK